MDGPVFKIDGSAVNTEIDMDSSNASTQGYYQTFYSILLSR